MRDFINRLNGWQRLWAICASVWVMWVVWELLYVVFSVGIMTIWNEEHSLEAFLWMLATIFLPPIFVYGIVYGIGVTIAWILAGFRN